MSTRRTVSILPKGPVRMGLVGPKRVTSGLPRAEAMCIGPLSLAMTRSAPRATAAIPLREFGTPEQCADAFLFLASDESDYITGVSLLVDGGACAAVLG